MYTVRGQIIERSTSGVMGPYFPYDPVAVTDRFYDTWASPTDPRRAHKVYHPMICAELARGAGGDAESAKAAIREMLVLCAG